MYEVKLFDYLADRAKLDPESVTVLGLFEGQKYATAYASGALAASRLLGFDGVVTVEEVEG
jgi:hypothetical protein